MGAAIGISKLSVAIDHKPVLTNINASVREGSIVGLLGPSGSGKTTLIRTILGLQMPSAGAIHVLGLLPGMSKDKVGYVAQSPSVYSDLTVAENVRYFAALRGISQPDWRTVIKNVELDTFSNVIVSKLSGGQTTRVSLAIALLGKPKILLLDEPTVGLDPVLRQKLWQQFETLAQAGTTILISSHVMDEADKCDHVIFLRDGKVLIADSRDSVLKKTKTKSMEAAFLELAGAKS